MWGAQRIRQDAPFFGGAINGLETIDEGLILVEGKAVGKRFENGRWGGAGYRGRAMQDASANRYGFQQFNLFPHMTALEMLWKV